MLCFSHLLLFFSLYCVMVNLIKMQTLNSIAKISLSNIDNNLNQFKGVRVYLIFLNTLGI